MHAGAHLLAADGSTRFRTHFGCCCSSISVPSPPECDRATHTYSTSALCGLYASIIFYGHSNVGTHPLGS